MFTLLFSVSWFNFCGILSHACSSYVVFREEVPSTVTTTGTTNVKGYGAGSAATGPCFLTLQHINPELLTIIRESKEKYTLIYNNDKRIHIKSDRTFGTLCIFDSKFGERGSPSISVRRGEILDHIKTLIEKKSGERVKFYGREESEFTGCFIDCVFNKEGTRCVNARVDGVVMLLPISELYTRSGTFTFILKSRQLKRSNEQTGELLWSLVITELDISPLPKDYEGYFKKRDQPEVHFVNEIQQE